MRKLLMLVVCMVAVAAVSAASASAANWPDTRLDAVASAVAGHPVSVYCESSWLPWETYFASQGIDGTFVGGFTVPSDPVVYMSPRACETLHALYTNGPTDVGNYYASSSVLTLVHESEHQRGFRDEGQTDCAALGAIRQIAVAYFGYHETTTESYLAPVSKRVGKRRVTTYVVRSRTIPDSQLTSFVAYALAWHKIKPAEYQGTC